MSLIRLPVIVCPHQLPCLHVDAHPDWVGFYRPILDAAPSKGLVKSESKLICPFTQLLNIKP